MNSKTYRSLVYAYELLKNSDYLVGEGLLKEAKTVRNMGMRQIAHMVWVERSSIGESNHG